MNLEKIRQDFPPLQIKFNGKPVIYFDNACMSLRPKQVIEKISEYYKEYPGCAGRAVHKFGKRVTEEFGRARETIAKHIGARQLKEIIFTKNTTEGINLVANSFRFEKGDIVLTSDREHNSNLLPWQMLKEKGIQHKIVFSNSDGSFNLENFKSSLAKNVKLVSIVHQSNLDGYTLPVREIIKLSHDNGSLVLLDAAQSVPHKKIDVRKLDVDFLAFSGHKMCGPSGTGVLYGKSELLKELKPFIVGGDTVKNTTYETHEFLESPEKFEAGLQDYAGAIGLAEAAKYLDSIGKENFEPHETKLNKIITEGISSISGLKILGPKNPESRGGIISFVIDKINYHDVAIMLDEMQNIMVRSGQHCVHSWFNAHGLEGSVRASLYIYNTKEEAEVFIEALQKIARLR